MSQASRDSFVSLKSRGNFGDELFLLFRKMMDEWIITLKFLLSINLVCNLSIHLT